MTGVGFHVICCLTFVLFPCQGEIISPPDGTELTFLNGSNANITWLFDDDISTVVSRAWYFTSSDGSFNAERLAIIVFDQAPQIEKSSLSGVTIVKPATLILKNVDQTYNGTYRFALATRTIGYSAEVDIFIAMGPNVTLSCSSSTTLYEGDDFTCVCRGEGGNPPADVTWYKDGDQIGGTGKEEQTLTLTNVDGTDNGTYKCVTQRHTNATDEKSIEIIVNFKPNNTTLTPNTAVVGTSVVITCKSEGLPEPRYTITRNGTVVSTNTTYSISEVMGSDAGTCTYKCIASNKFGNDSGCSNLTVLEPRPPPTSPPTTGPLPTRPLSTIPQPTSKESTTTNPDPRPPPTSPPTTGPQPTSKESTATNPDKPSSNNTSSGIEWYIIAVILVSGIIIVILLSYIVWCSRRRWFRNRKPEQNPESQTTEANTTYQALDLTTMNTEDNYQ